MSPPPVRRTATHTARPSLAAPLPPVERARRDPRVDPPADCLSRRERAVVIALCEGLDRPEIAIYRNSGFGTAHQVVAWAHRIGLFGGATGASAEPRR